MHVCAPAPPPTSFTGTALTTRHLLLLLIAPIKAVSLECGLQQVPQAAEPGLERRDLCLQTDAGPAPLAQLYRLQPVRDAKGTVVGEAAGVELLADEAGLEALAPDLMLAFVQDTGVCAHLLLLEVGV